MLTPQTGKRSAGAAERIGCWEWKRAHAIAFGLRRGAAADVPRLLWRISAYDEEVGRGLQTAVARAGRKYNDVAGIESEFVTAGTAEDYARVAGCYAENFMCC